LRSVRRLRLAGGGGVKLGFACVWDARSELTWALPSRSLRSALDDRGDPADSVVDLGVSYPPALRAALRAATARRHDGRWVSMWRHARPAREYAEEAVRRALRRSPCDVVLQIQDLVALDTPFLLYQGLSYDVLLEHAENGDGPVRFSTLSRDAVLRLRDRQHQIFEQAARVLAMSPWLAEHLVARSGLPAGKVQVVHPGASVAQNLDPATLAAAHERRLAGPRRRLLFVGTEFHAKAGGAVVAALALLRRKVDPEITLTVVGPDGWALPGEPPEGVHFLRRVPVEAVGPLYDEHDLFVLPSRYEAVGIAFVEALAHGVPCIGRNAYAMADIVRPGINGDLVDGDDVEVLADRIAGILDDPGVYRRTYAEASDVARRYSWGRAADALLVAARAATAH
jgi:glycosyltransferase involved in cell wall biosynthesis